MEERRASLALIISLAFGLLSLTLSTWEGVDAAATFNPDHHRVLVDIADDADVPCSEDTCTGICKQAMQDKFKGAKCADSGFCTCL